MCIIYLNINAQIKFTSWLFKPKKKIHMKEEVIINDFFDPQGALGKIVKNYHIRTEQIEMAKLVQNAIESNESLIVEAGTGVGKTFAYLVPAIINGGKSCDINCN